LQGAGGFWENQCFKDILEIMRNVSDFEMVVAKTGGHICKFILGAHAWIEPIAGPCGYQRQKKKFRWTRKCVDL
jgi:hypothetical protein